MKKLSLDRAWRLCLKQQWKWMIAQLKKGSKAKVETLKKRWFRLYKPNDIGKIQHNCYFCEYDKQREDNCLNCPAVLIDPDFHCRVDEYDYKYEPYAFYAELQALHKIFLLDKKRRAKK